MNSSGSIHTPNFYVNTDGSAGFKGTVTIGGNNLTTSNTLNENTVGSDLVASYYGETPDEERQPTINEFQNPDSQLQYLVSNVQTGGYGITLTQAKNVIYYSNNFAFCFFVFFIIN